MNDSSFPDEATEAQRAMKQAIDDLPFQVEIAWEGCDLPNGGWCVKMQVASDHDAIEPTGIGNGIVQSDN